MGSEMCIRDSRCVGASSGVNIAELIREHQLLSCLFLEWWIWGAIGHGRHMLPERCTWTDRLLKDRATDVHNASCTLHYLQVIGSSVQQSEVRRKLLCHDRSLDVRTHKSPRPVPVRISFYRQAVVACGSGGSPARSGVGGNLRRVSVLLHYSQTSPDHET